MKLDARSILQYFRIGTLVAVLLTIALLSAVLTMHFAIHGREVKVPDLKGMTVAEARSETAGLGLDMDVDNRYYSADVAPGHILSQSPAPGAVVRREWRVRIAESLGPQKVDVPDTIGQQERIAALNLRRAGLDVGTIARIPWPKAAEGTVIAQDPPAHAQGIESPSIHLLVAASAIVAAAEAAPDGQMMPNLVGMPVIVAQQAIAKAGLKPAQPRYSDVSVGNIGPSGSLPKPPVLPGTVIAQQPVPGYRVDLNTQIVLKVAK